jgi:hypothetical protein
MIWREAAIRHSQKSLEGSGRHPVMRLSLFGGLPQASNPPHVIIF